MNGKIALEEHFATPEYNRQRPFFIGTESWKDVQERIVDFESTRLDLMDRCGIGYAVISLTSPGVQGEQEPRLAVERARIANDVLAEAIAARPDRFGGFAAVALQDVGAAVAELRRAVTDLGFHGVLVNSWSDMPDGSTRHLDDAALEPFWQELTRLDVPLYLHPRLLPATQRGMLTERPELAGPVWEFTSDASASALRLITGGLLDRHPTAQIILGHLGESLPYNIWRIDNRMLKAADRPPLDHSLTHYLTHNFHITTSGHFCTPSLQAAIDVMGADRVMFSVDYPYDDMPQACAWFDEAPLTDDLRRRIGRDNALRLLSIKS